MKTKVKQGGTKTRQIKTKRVQGMAKHKMPSLHGNVFLITDPAIAREINRSLVDSLHKGTVMESLDIYFVVSPKKLLHKQSTWAWFETPRAGEIIVMCIIQQSKRTNISWKVALINKWRTSNIIIISKTIPLSSTLSWRHKRSTRSSEILKNPIEFRI